MNGHELLTEIAKIPEASIATKCLLLDHALMSARKHGEWSVKKIVKQWKRKFRTPAEKAVVKIILDAIEAKR